MLGDNTSTKLSDQGGISLMSNSKNTFLLLNCFLCQQLQIKIYCKSKAQISVFYKITFVSTSVTLGPVLAASVNAATSIMPKHECNSL